MPSWNIEQCLKYYDVSQVPPCQKSTWIVSKRFRIESEIICHFRISFFSVTWYCSYNVQIVIDEKIDRTEVNTHTQLFGTFINSLKYVFSSGRKRIDFEKCCWKELNIKSVVWINCSWKETVGWSERQTTFVRFVLFRQEPGADDKAAQSCYVNVKQNECVAMYL